MTLRLHVIYQEGEHLGNFSNEEGPWAAGAVNMETNKTVDFGTRNFVDAVLVAARERVFTAALGWLLSDQSTLDSPSRKKVLSELSGLDFAACDEIKYVAEWNNIDLLIKGLRQCNEVCAIAVEMKLKSSESDGQLTRYDDNLRTLNHPTTKIFLTLSGEEPRSGQGWQPLACADLLVTLMEIPGRDKYLNDLRDALGRLIAVEACVRTRIDIAGSVFQPAAPAAFEPTNSFESYLKDFRLRTFAQRVWMAELQSKLEIASRWVVNIRETNGEALLDIEAESNTKPLCRVGLELQKRSLKLYVSPWPYDQRATREQQQMVDKILKDLGKRFGISGKKPTAHRNRGFRSYSLQKTLPLERDVQAYAKYLQPWINKLQEEYPDAQSLR
ncbi:PD-(D/E)XK nuclease family protein [Mesorhizobium sp. AR07]|uniref:PD-(D/E)XK nuclease family protein n=1 Tax=Mesorhizobium sp. AR07 TaxID=2865838 RepID=UPI00215EDDEB|nr:PD-(D/E)XK nuclease family protein [Mesorhizobium sp. AR07]UVK43639.1 PD-(D/E)XK nuclease family protein [Mesorhizobium sp. AR07]